MLKTLPILLLAWLTTVCGWAKPEKVVVAGGRLVDVGTRSGSYLDNTCKLQPWQFVTGNYRDSLTYMHREILCYGITDGRSWVKFSVNNTGNEKAYLALNLPTVDSSALYKVVNDTPVLLDKQGIRPPLKHWQVKTEAFLYDLHLVHDSATYLLWVNDSRGHFYSLSAGNLADFFGVAEWSTLVFAINVGFVLMLSFYNFFLFLTMRDIAYLYYVCFNIMYCLFFSVISGIAFRYTPFLLTFANHSDNFFGAATLTFGGLFTLRFLDVRLYSRRMFYLTSFFTGLLGLAAVMSLVGFNEVAFKMIPGTSFFLLTAEIAVTLNAIRWGNKSAGLFLLGWGTAAAAVIVYILGIFNIYSFNHYTIQLPQLASTFEAVIFSYALADRTNRYRQEKEDLIISQNLMLETKVIERTRELSLQKQETEKLLLNILPADVAEELKAKGKAEARFFTDVTVLFTDFKGFTTVAERMSPQQLVGELDTCFKAFDAIMRKYGIEKIKTVGDAYLAAAGLPAPSGDHAQTMVNAALEIRDFMLERRKMVGEDTFEIRIGIHTGNVVAGIVGDAKFAYDIWGDTVNTAARMEQNSVPGKINISESVYALVQDAFVCEYRGKVAAKNKGELGMYFVDRHV
jgi:class 3 adenylate cyclase